MNTANRPRRVWIAESNLQVRQTLRIFLEERLSCLVVGESETVDDLIEQIGSTSPDLLLIAWELLNSGSGCLLDELHMQFLQMKVICLGSRPGTAAQAIAAGADAFASKADHPLRLKAVIEAALA